MVRIKHEHIDFPGLSTININYAQRPYFRHPWHFHEEHQITYVIKGSGTRFVGDHIETFCSGDLVLVAGNLPHYWRSDEKYYLGDPSYHVDRLIIQFPNDFMRFALSNYPEFLHINHLMQKAMRGIRFLPPGSDMLGNMLLKLKSVKGFRQVMQFVEILNQMATAKDTELLSSENYQAGKDELTDDRLKKIIRYLTSNYCRTVSHSELADVASMHRVSLCRYFKEKTGKNISTYINELRVGFACKLLQEGTLQISQVCFESGFNNISNFNRHFKRITDMTPKQYKEEFYEKHDFSQR